MNDNPFVYDANLKIVTGGELAEGMTVYDRMRVRWFTLKEIWVSDAPVLGVTPMVFTGVYADGQTKAHHTNTEATWTITKKDSPEK